MALPTPEDWARAFGPRTVPEALIAWRRRAGALAKDAAALLGVGRSFICDLEASRRHLTDERILACSHPGLRSALLDARVREYKAAIATLEASRPCQTPAPLPS
jgi:hypothetical protein